MISLRKLFALLHNLLRRNRTEDDLSEELQFHLDQEIEKNIRIGMNPEEARYAALRSLGGVEQIEEECRDIVGITLVESIFQDIRYGFRMLLQHRSFTFISVLILALGIGANSAVFSVANAVFLRSLPVDEAERLLMLTRPERAEEPFSYPEYLDYRERNRVFSGLLAYYPLHAILGRGSQTEVIPSELVSGNYFALLGISAPIGRTFLPEEDGAPGAHLVAVISHDLWKRRFNSDPQIIGQLVRLNKHEYNVVGVAPEGFKGVSSPYAIDVWVPMAMHTQMMPMSRDSLEQRQARWLSLVGRLRPEISVTRARAGMTALDQQLQWAYPKDYPSAPGQKLTMALVRPQGFYFLRQNAAVATAFLISIAGLVLLIACSNVANLLLARGMARAHEIAVRRALGASRTRLLRQLLTESLLLSLLGTAVGLLVAVWTAQSFSKLLADIPAGGYDSFAAATIATDFSLDSRVLLLTLLLGGLTALIFGSLPAVQVSQPGPVLAQRGLAAYPIRLRRVSLAGWLVVAQMAISLVLVIAAGMLLRTLLNLNRVEPGFQTQRQLVLSMDMTMEQYNRPDYQRFSQHLLDRLQSLPGVKSVSLADSLLGGYNFQASVLAEDQAHREGGLTVGISSVRPHYFETLRIPLVKGRDFNDRDIRNGAAIVIVNETLAHCLWPGQEVIGKRIRVRGADLPSSEVIAIAKDVKYRSLREEPSPFIYVPLDYSDMIYALISSRTNSRALLRAAENEVHGLDENVVVKSKTLDEQLQSTLWLPRMTAALLGGFALLGLLLATTGLYGVVSYSVTCRTKEMGIRMVLGATKLDVIRLILSQGLALAVFGAVFGVAVALAVVRSLQGLLYGVGPIEVFTYLGASTVMVIAALVASYFPALHATRADPIAALRYE